jgi:hypothetical protein
MYKPLTFFPHLSPNIEDLFLIEWDTRFKPHINSVKVHPQLNHNGHPLDGALVGAAPFP